MVDEQLSAFLDEESDATEIERSIRALKADADYRQSWQRQLLVREVLHNDNAPPSVDTEFADRVTAALDAEAAESDKVVPIGRKVRGPRWWQGAAGLATAASAAAAAVLAVQPFAAVDGINSAEPTTIAAADERAASDTFAESTSTVARASREAYNGPGMVSDHWTVSDPAVAKQLNSYLLEHNGLANSYGLFGARPSFVRVAAYGVSSGR